MIDLKAIDLVQVVEQAGVNLRRQGSNYVGLCPFHQERNPSFCIFPDNHFKCWGCGTFGDTADFVQKYYGCDFKEALKILGVENGPVTPERKAEIDRLKEERRLVKAFRNWERKAVDEVSLYCRTARRLLFKIRNEGDLMKYGEIYHLVDRWEWHHEILCSGDDQLKFQLFESGIYG